MLMLRSSALLLATLHNPHLATFLTFRSTRLFMTLKNQNQKSGSTPKKSRREYELQFLDGPIVLPQEQDGDNGEAAGNESSTGECTDDENTPRSWWLRSPDEKSHILGGTLATALALSGAFPNLRCVVTAGAPFVAEAFQEAALLTKECGQAHSDSLFDLGLRIPKFHMAGETDALVAVESTRQLSENGGNGTFVMHDQGHLFPTRSLRVQEVLDFLSKHIDKISPS
ncbi:hypothetical protein HJC23_008714 [Cyclotella cryptica]|uniref:Serine hydrolase domain-containing protein n=1 Tax=Cyclotella cryptica TaxID=29204 RepID=A0ABD3QGW9_9STRA